MAFGVADGEMGLLHGMITECQRVMRAEPGSFTMLEMLGQSFLEKDKPGVAIRMLEWGLEPPAAVGGMISWVCTIVSDRLRRLWGTRIQPGSSTGRSSLCI